MIPVCGGSYGFIFCKYGSIIGWGHNDKGQLAVEYDRDMMTIEPTSLDVLEKISLIKISSYHNQNWGLAENGSVYTWGENKLGYYPIETRYVRWKKYFFDTPKQIPYLTNVIDICCNDVSIAILNLDKELYFATNTDIKGKEFDENVFQLIEEKMKMIKSGGYHMLFLNENGEVFSIGDNTYGQLGLGHTKRVYEIQKIPTLENIVSISCGYFHSVALDEENKVWIWGYNGNNELGREFPWMLDIPTEVNNLPSDIKEIICGYQHTLVLTEIGDLWSWGNNTYGQLGLDKDVNSSCVPKLILSNISCVSASIYNVAISLDNEIYVWGNNKKGCTIKEYDESIIQIPIKINEYFEGILSNDNNTSIVSSDTRNNSMVSEGFSSRYSTNMTNDFFSTDIKDFLNKPNEDVVYKYNRKIKNQAQDIEEDNYQSYWNI